MILYYKKLRILHLKKWGKKKNLKNFLRSVAIGKPEG